MKINYIDHDGVERPIETPAGLTIMELAVNNDIPGIDADCSGACACATCHVYVDSSMITKLPAKASIEEAMLEMVDDLKDNSRLACQVVLTEDMDGLTVTTPEYQG